MRHHSRGGQLIAHVKALPGDPCDSHRLRAVSLEMKAQIRADLSRVVAGRG
jgi:IS5 family transposase